MTIQTAIVMTPDTLRQLDGVPTGVKRVGRTLLRTKQGRLNLTLPDGRVLVFGEYQMGQPDADITIASYDVFAKALRGGDVGFAEAYMDGDWTSDDLTGVLEYFSQNFEAAGNLVIGRFLARLVNRMRHMVKRNSRSGSRRNIEAHYDLGNAFYEAWLDPSMTYSSGMFDNPNISLEQAQAAKYDAICHVLRVKPGDHVLEIGCGWGGFAEFAVTQRDARVTCLTLSKAQLAYAQSRLDDRGLADRVEFRLEDYRDHHGEYDCVASIEMFEAVGEAYWPAYFRKLHDVLKPGGRAALQIITIRDELFKRYRKRADFIQRYVFPGGMLPSDKRLREEFQNVRLKLENVTNFAPDYAETLKRWSRRFNQQWTRLVEPLGFDLRFRRLWNFYLSYCEAGFRNARLDVGQYALSKPVGS